MAIQQLASMESKTTSMEVDAEAKDPKLATPTSSPHLSPLDEPVPLAASTAGAPADQQPLPPPADADGKSSTPLPEAKKRDGSRSPRRALSPSQKSGASSAGSALSRKSKQSPEHYAQLASTLEQRLKLSKTAHVVETAARP